MMMPGSEEVDFDLRPTEVQFGQGYLSISSKGLSMSSTIGCVAIR